MSVFVPEGNVSYLTVEVEQKGILRKQQRKQLREQADIVEYIDNAAWRSLRNQAPKAPKGCRTLLLEVFAGTLMLTAMAAAAGWAVSEPVDIELNGIDVYTRGSQGDVWRAIEQDCPYIVTMAYPCQYWSSWQRVNCARGPDTKEKIENGRIDALRGLRWVRKVAEEQVRHGKVFLLENPETSEAWSTVPMQELLRLPGVDYVTCDQCQYGAHDERSGLAVKKPTRFVSNCPLLLQALSKRCQRDHQHQQLEGSSRTAKAAAWPPGLCKAILAGINDSLINIAFPAEALEEAALGAEPIDAPDGEELMNAELRETPVPTAAAGDFNEDVEIERHERQLEQGFEGEVELARVKRERWTSFPLATRASIRKLHTMTGHASVTSMLRMLSGARAGADAVAACQHFSCPACETMRAPARVRVVKPPSRYVFNAEVLLDIFEVKDAAGHRYSVPSLVCAGTTFHVAGVVRAGGGTPSSRTCFHMFTTRWASWAGWPEMVTTDRGLRNRGEYAAGLQQRRIVLRQVGLESPQQLGCGERHGGLLKQMIQKCVVDRQVTGEEAMERVIASCLEVKNSMNRHGGFSPTQWVIGRHPRAIASMMTEEAPAEVGPVSAAAWDYRVRQDFRTEAQCHEGIRALRQQPASPYGDGAWGCPLARAVQGRRLRVLPPAASHR